MKKSIFYFFTKTYGISNSLAFKMCSFINVAPQKENDAVSELKKKQAFHFLQNAPFNKKIDLTLKSVESKALMHYSKINNIKGFKLRSFLPINGQRNKRNAKTARKNAIAFSKIIGNLKNVKKNNNEKENNRK